MKQISLDEFWEWIKERHPLMQGNEYGNSLYLHKMASENKCKECGKLEGVTIFLSEEYSPSVTIMWVCPSCYDKKFGVGIDG